MKRHRIFHLLCCIVLIALLAACRPTPQATEYPAGEHLLAYQPKEVLKTVAVDRESSDIAEATAYPPAYALPQATPIAAMPGGAVPLGGALLQPMVIKNAEMRLLVEDTSVAAQRLTQVVEDLGGYIISSRSWVQEQYGENYQYASFTLGVPVDEFETALRRLRALAIKVLDEVASGQDVSEEYVDLQSRLENLEATRARVRAFLDQAQDVEEALKVNAELARIEEEIELIQGRMNYLSKRVAISTITVYLEPETLHATPTPTPAAWDPRNTVGSASRTLTAILRGLVDAAIWVGIVILPLVGVPALIAFAIWRLRRRGKPSGA